MVPNPTDPTSPSNKPHHHEADATSGTSKGSSGVHYKGGQIEAKPITFLGMYFDADEAKKLWSVIIQSINNQISKDNDKAVKALKKWGKAQSGDDPDD